MAVHETYHEGGFRPRHPSRNLAEQRDDEKRIVRRWDEKGKLVEERPYTRDEVAAIITEPDGLANAQETLRRLLSPDEKDPPVAEAVRALAQLYAEQNPLPSV